MKIKNFRKFIFMTAITALLMAISVQFSSSAMAFSIPSEVSIEATVATSVKGEVIGYVYRHGEKMQASSVLPGEVIHWEMSLTNTAGYAVNNVKFDGDVPSGTVYVANSASSAEFSLNGKTFSRNPMMRDSSGKLVSAPASAYKVVRFTVSLNAGETKTVTYKTTVK